MEKVSSECGCSSEGAVLLPFVDTHHHLWDLGANYYPWLHDTPHVAFRYGDYAELTTRNFLSRDYQEVSRGHRVVATVVIEGEWDGTDSLGETRWIAKLIQSTGRPTVFVAHTELNSDRVDSALAEHGSYAFVRGIRDKPARVIDRTGRTLMSDPSWRSGFQRLAHHGFHFELQVPWTHLQEAVELGDRYPDVPIILNHAGLPMDRSDLGIRGWRRAMARFAELPHVSVKISGLGGENGWWNCAANTQIVRETIEIVGSGRCMIGSNYPVDSLCVDFDTMLECYRSAISHLTTVEQNAIMSENAIRIYRLREGGIR